jgi:hypothetical protein
MAVLVVVACLFLPMDTHSTTQKVQTMKRTFKSLLAVAGLAFIGLGSLLTTTPAQAALTYTNIMLSQTLGVQSPASALTVIPIQATQFLLLCRYGSFWN